MLAKEYVTQQKRIYIYNLGISPGTTYIQKYHGKFERKWAILPVNSSHVCVESIIVVDMMTCLNTAVKMLPVSL